jgi:hypothetical protein
MDCWGSYIGVQEPLCSVVVRNYLVPIMINDEYTFCRMQFVLYLYNTPRYFCRYGQLAQKKKSILKSKHTPNSKTNILSSGSLTKYNSRQDKEMGEIS